METIYKNNVSKHTSQNCLS